MIDWQWLRLLAVPVGIQSLQPGRIVSLDADGAIEWQTMKWMQARGSNDQTMAVRRTSRDQLEISGSPAKFLQGHNAFGSDDQHGLAREVVTRVCAMLNLELSPYERFQIDEGHIELLRTDVNYSYGTSSRAASLAWIRGAELHGYLQHRGRGMLKGTTVVWGSKSRHWQLKAYCKGQEIEAGKGHALPRELVHRDQVTAWCDDKLRIEAQFNARYLKDRGLDLVCNWKMDTPAVLHSEHLSKLQLSGDMKLQPDQIETLRRGFVLLISPGLVVMTFAHRCRLALSSDTEKSCSRMASISPWLHRMHSATWCH